MTAEPTPLVSVVVPCRNHARFLGEALRSALAQTHSPLEVLLVDDASTDGSREVAAALGVRVVDGEGAGVERAVNLGVREARGELVVRLDADDVLEPRYVERLLAALRRAPDAAYAYCTPRFFGARTGTMRCFPFSPYFLVLRSNFVSASALVRRADFLAAGGYATDLGEAAQEDWELWLRLLARGRRGTFVREPLLRWRRHEGGSRNPEGEAFRRSAETIRARHADLVRAASGLRGRANYGIEVALALVDLTLGLSRSPGASSAIERFLWRRWQRGAGVNLRGGSAAPPGIAGRRPHPGRREAAELVDPVAAGTHEPQAARAGNRPRRPRSPRPLPVPA